MNTGYHSTSEISFNDESVNKYATLRDISFESSRNSNQDGERDELDANIQLAQPFVHENPAYVTLHGVQDGDVTDMDKVI